MDTASPRDRLLHIVVDLLAAGGEARPFSCEEQLSAVGLTSLDMVSLMFAIENEFDITLDQSDITPENFSTLATVEALVARLAPAGG